MGSQSMLMRAFIGFTILSVIFGGIVMVVGRVRGNEGAQLKLEQRFDQLDSDGDGRLTAGELPQRRLFEALDQDRDGEVTKAEARQAVASGALRGWQDARQSDPVSGVTSATPPAQFTQPVRQGPRPLLPGDHGVGRLVPATTYTDLDGRSHTVGGGEARFTLFAMTSTSCPLSRKYLPTLVELAAAAPEGVRFVLVNATPTDPPEAMREAALRFSGGVTYVHDREGALARALGATTTTDVVVIDARRTVEYHGAIDDQYGFGYALAAPRHRYLADALRALAAGEAPPVAATDAPGCDLDTGEARTTLETTVTYHNRISRILDRHCVECHREGAGGPCPLGTYDDAVGHAAMIATGIRRDTMPPWFAAPMVVAEAVGHSPHHSPWANDRSLAESEKKDLLSWLANGRPLGDAGDALKPRDYPDGWQIGTPDAVFEFAEPVQVKATGVMPYLTVNVETRLPEDRWVRAIEVQPGDRNVVHHALIHLARAEEVAASPRDARTEAGQGFWGEYVPGQNTLEYPDGFARLLPKGAWLRFQMHYTPNGTATTDRTRVGVIFAKEPPRHEVRVAGIVNARISIPPGAADHREEATLRLPFNATIMGFMPHMHVRGKACRYAVARGNGPTTTLLDIPRYDFNWQLLYRLYEPLPLAAGDTLSFTAWYDNSAANPANPDPTKTVRWGPQTFDEMHLGYVEYFVPGATPGQPLR